MSPRQAPSPVSLGERQFAAVLGRAVLLPLILILLGALALLWQLQRGNRIVDRLESAGSSVVQCTLIERLIVDQETGLRGYQTTGHAVFLDTFHNADHPLTQLIGHLETSFAGDPEALALLSQLKMTHDSWEQGFAVPLIATMQAGGKTDDVNLNLLGKQQMDSMRQILVQLSRKEERARSEQVTRWDTHVRRVAFMLAVFAASLALLIGFYTTAQMRSLLAAFRASSATLRKRADEALQSEQRLRITLSSIGEAVITCDPAGCVQSLNEVAARLTGVSEELASGQRLGSVLNLLSPVTRDALQDPFQAALQNMPEPEDALLAGADGQESVIESSGTLLYNASGTVTGYVFVFRDVTVARQREAALLSSEKLAVTGRLAASIAHEIHNPLDAVSNLLFLMDGVSSPEESAEFLELARGEIARVTQISRAMLSLHRESAAPVAVDLREMLLSVLLLMDNRLTMLRVRVESSLPEEISIQGFPAELRQVVTNLLTNAAEASPAGGVLRLSVVAAPSYFRTGSDRPETGACIVIEDHGPGIPDATLNRLFEPFVTTKGEAGTGLGLWISKGIVTRHGGEIVVESSTDEADHGTTVSVFLPAWPESIRSAI